MSYTVFTVVVNKAGHKVRYITVRYSISHNRPMQFTPSALVFA